MFAVICFSQFDLKASDKYQSLYLENQHRCQIAFSVVLHRVWGDREGSDSRPSDVAQTAQVNTDWVVLPMAPLTEIKMSQHSQEANLQQAT